MTDKNNTMLKMLLCHKGLQLVVSNRGKLQSGIGVIRIHLALEMVLTSVNH